jgi:hypothetical protein
MAQHDYNIANQGFPAFRSDLNNALSAIQTTNSGTSRPTGAVAGQLWLDTTSPTTPTLKYYDGADDISLATIDHSANTVNWLDSTVSITGLSTTATGTVLTLSDTATTSTVNLIIDNDKEIRFREATANGTNYVSLSAPASLSADLTFTLPATDGTVGQVLTTNGSGVLSFATVGGLAWQSIVTASTLTAVASRGYWINTTSNACTVTLPASATNGDTIILADYLRTWGTNAVTINPNSLKFQGYTSPNPVYNTNGQSVTLVYSGATQGWIPTVDDDVTNEVPQTYTVDFLVLAGGGAGGRGGGGGQGGGGAGGYRSSNATYGSSGRGSSAESNLTFNAGTVYTVTVGAGGSGVTGSPQTGTTGSNSSLSGTGITTITSSGGGGGAQPQGASGGCGGGSGESYTSGGGAGTANQGYDGGIGSGSGYGAGGGGTGAVGKNGGSNSGDSDGGAGTASTITGSSVTRGGGGGGTRNGLLSGRGGTGGGGNGGAGSGGSGTIQDGTANTGGGGGGAHSPNNATSGAGGSGVVILRMPTAKYTGTTTGSPTVSTSGSDTILTFTASGSYTA